MSTINAQNYGDGTDSVPASAVLEGTAKATFRGSQTGIDVSYNFSSFTDDGVGDFVLNFTNSVLEANGQGATSHSGTGARISIMSNTVSEMRVRIFDTAGVISDNAYTGAYHGALA